MCIIPIYWGQLDQRGIKVVEGGRGARLLFQVEKFEKNLKTFFFLVNSVINLLIR